MKNMKKLLGAMAALGFTTVAAVNVVACSKPAASNDLTKSFNSSYNTTAVDTTAQSNWGLSAPTATGFTFKFLSIDSATIKSLIKPTDATVPVKDVSTETSSANFQPASAAGEELAQITSNTVDGTVNISGDNKTVSIMFTLKLWKAVAAGSSSGNWVDQSTSMTVTVNIDTTSTAKNLSNLTTISAISKMNLNTQDLTAVPAADIKGSADFKNAIQSAVSAFATGTTTDEYAFDLAGASGGPYTNLNLTTANTATYVKITATNSSQHIAQNSSTDWIQVTLPIANNLSVIAAGDIGTLTAANFGTVTATAVTKANILTAIKNNNALLTAVQALNSMVTDVTNATNLNIKVATTPGGADMTAPVDASGASGVTVYITITPGTTALVAGTTAELTVQIPKLS